MRWRAWRYALSANASPTACGAPVIKLGLALSGGGLRAALFHVGVLARLAECGLLRRVEVLSVVSGGAITGALWYLRLKRLLEAHPDAELGDADYVALVEALEGDVGRAAGLNLKLRGFASPWANLRMALTRYSRTERLAGLFDALLFAPLAGAAGGPAPLMREIVIQPAGAAPGFDPRRNNVGRRCTVPLLLVNATLLNTGHAWRFEPGTMGPAEPSGRAADEIDKNARLGRARSWAELPPAAADVTLGMAVAASSSLPGALTPLVLPGVAPGGMRLAIADGGLHDNQGVQALVDEGCTHLVVSDASAQLEDLATPGMRAWAAVERANDILADRVRELELRRLFEPGGWPHAFIHLLADVPVGGVPIGDGGGSPPGQLPYGVRADVQRLLASVRTDLDAFGGAETAALALDGYLVAGRVLSLHPEMAPLATVPTRGAWRFLAATELLVAPTPAGLRQLAVSRFGWLRECRLTPRGTLAAGVSVLALLASVLAWQGSALAPLLRARIELWQLALLLAVLTLGVLPAGPAPGRLDAVRRLARALVRWSLGVAVAVVTAALVRAYLATGGRLYLRLGRLAPGTDRQLGGLAAAAEGDAVPPAGPSGS